MSSSETIYLYRDFAAGVYLSEAPSPAMTPYPPPLPRIHVLYYLYTYYWGGGGGGENQREATVHKAGWKILT